MTEFSLFYTTDGVGDGASSITEAQLADFFNRMFVRDKTRMGYIKGYLDELAPTLNGRVISVASGAGMCDGHGYGCDGVETHTVPIPTVGTTGWQLVLRHDPSLRKTRQTLKNATDGVATPPTVTQSEGGTWEIELARGTITTGGVAALTDTRVAVEYPAGVNVDTLTDTLLPTTHRQGGHSTIWGGLTPPPGVRNNYTLSPGLYQIQVGYDLSQPSSTAGTVSVTFPQAFAGDPIIFCQVNVGTPEYYDLITHKAVPTGVGTGFDFIWEKRNDSVVLVQELGFSWMAIGPMAS